MTTRETMFVKGMGEVILIHDPDDDEGSVLVESTLTHKRYWVDTYRLEAADDNDD